MKKLLFAVMALIMWPAAAQDFKEGVHYEVIAETATAKPEAIEFFSFYCGACFRYEPIAAALKAAYPSAFRKSHVPVGNDEFAKSILRATVVAERMKVAEGFSAMYFRRQHVEQKPVMKVQDLHDMLRAQGLTDDQVEKAMSSFMVKVAADRIEKEAEKYSVRVTPTFIVNGKYRINPQGLADSEEFTTEMVKLVGYLLDKK